MPQRKKYSAEFEAETAELARSFLSSVNPIVREIGVGPTLLNLWGQEARNLVLSKSACIGTSLMPD